MRSSSAPGLGTSSDEEKKDVQYQLPELPPQPVRAPVRMADQVEDDPELATLNAQADGDPPQAIVFTPGQTACDVNVRFGILKSMFRASFDRIESCLYT